MPLPGHRQSSAVTNPGPKSPIKDNRGTGARTPVTAFLQMPEQSGCESHTPGAAPGTPESPQHPGLSPGWQVESAAARGSSGWFLSIIK